MGYAGDVLGRNRAFVVTSLIMVASALLSALLPNGDTNFAMAAVAASRFFLGWGIGGCYPLSAAKSAEESSSSLVWERNFAVGVVFFWQTLGDIAPYLMGMLLSEADVYTQFRVTLALGALPPLAVLACTCKAVDSSEFAAGAAGSGEVRVRKSWIEQLRIGMTDPGWRKKLAATALCWGIYDVAYYGSNQFTPTMTEKIFAGSSIFATSWHGAIDMCVGIPATLHALYSMRSMGSKRLQVYGFLFIGFACTLVAALWTTLTDCNDACTTKSNILFAVYLLFYYSVNWGPNMTTFVLPQEIYPIEIRGTFGGIAAAAGKLGALVGIWLFEEVSKISTILLLLIVAGLNLAGALISHVCISDRLWKVQRAQQHGSADLCHAREPDARA